MNPIVEVQFVMKAVLILVVLPPSHY